MSSSHRSVLTTRGQASVFLLCLALALAPSLNTAALQANLRVLRGFTLIDGTGRTTLQTGKWADLIVLARNPLDDIKNTQTITDVYIAGNKVN